MKCEECGASLGSGLILGCEACGMLPSDCTCKRDLGHIPQRRVTCIECDRVNVATVDTTSDGWRSKEV